MKLTEFMSFDFYLNYLDDLDAKLLVKIDRDSTVHEIVMAIEIDSLGHAPMTLDDLKWLINNEKAQTINYISGKLNKYLEPDGDRDNIVNLAPKANFPIGHLIEYYLLSKRPDNLLDYVKTIRIPDAKRYAKEIRQLFSEIKPS